MIDYGDYPKQLFAFCVNDDKPQFPVKMWIQKDRLYTADPKSIVRSPDDHSVAFIWKDADGNIIIPNAKVGVQHIKAKRFGKGFSICLN